MTCFHENNTPPANAMESTGPEQRVPIRVPRWLSGGIMTLPNFLQATVWSIVRITSFLLAGYLYSCGRTMVEEVGLTSQGITAGLIVVAVSFSFLSSILALTYLVGQYTKPRLLPVLRCILFSTILGVLVFEVRVLADELKFALEITNMKRPDVPYSREREWPNSTCSLVHVPGKGIHATD